MQMLAIALQNETTRSVLAWIGVLLQETALVLRRLFVLAADNMLVVAVFVAVIGILLLRPPHAPR